MKTRPQIQRTMAEDLDAARAALQDLTRQWEDTVAGVIVMYAEVTHTWQAHRKVGAELTKLLATHRDAARRAEKKLARAAEKKAARGAEKKA